MAIEVQRDEQDGVTVLTFTGGGTGADATVIADTFFSVRSEHDASRMLVDVRGVEGRLSYPDTYFFMRKLAHGPSAGKTAILESEAHREWATFHEATAANAGFRFRYFFDRDEALAWLRT